MLDSPTGNRLKYVIQVLYGENITNDAMEYKRLLAGLRAAIGLGIDKIIVKGDSQLVNKEYACPQMAPYVEEVWKLQRRFNSFRAVYVPPNENTVADELSQLASVQDPVPPGVYIEVLRRPSVSLKRPSSKSTATPGAGDPATSTPRVSSPEEAEDLVAPTQREAMLLLGRMVLPLERTYPPWAQDIVKYMMEHTLLADDDEAEKVARRAKLYVLIDGDLYR